MADADDDEPKDDRVWLQRAIVGAVITLISSILLAVIVQVLIVGKRTDSSGGPQPTSRAPTSAHVMNPDIDVDPDQTNLRLNPRPLLFITGHRWFNDDKVVVQLKGENISTTCTVQINGTLQTFCMLSIPNGMALRSYIVSAYGQQSGVITNTTWLLYEN